MNKCKNCGVRVITPGEKCPLCQGVLEGDEEGTKTYPDAARERRHVYFVYRIFLFISIVTGILCALINYYVTPHSTWSVIVIGCLVYGMVMFYLLVDENAGYRKRIFSGVIGAVLLIILVDYLTGFEGWSLDYVLPGAMILIDLSLVLLMLINHRNWQSYLILQLFMILICIVPLVLHYVGLIHNELLAIISFFITLILFIGSLTLGGRTAITELKRRFYV